ncbi:MAG: hypothetical protein JW915_18670 [Chitinispirillaceae bacterium]|nr:hypothetical protein [Chitinispirillaceae bacterium]
MIFPAKIVLFSKALYSRSVSLLTCNRIDITCRFKQFLWNWFKKGALLVIAGILMVLTESYRKRID